MIYSVSYSGRSYTARLPVGGATVGTCVYKTANIKGDALHVAQLSQVIFTGTGTYY